MFAKNKFFLLFLFIQSVFATDPIEETQKYLVIFFHATGQNSSTNESQITKMTNELVSKIPHLKVNRVIFKTVKLDAADFGEGPGVWFPYPNDLALNSFLPKLSGLIKKHGKPLGVDKKELWKYAGMKSREDLLNSSFFDDVIMPNMSEFLKERTDIINKQINNLLEKYETAPDKLVLAGHSMGGIIALSTALARPEDKKCLAVLSCNAFWMGGNINSKPNFVISTTGANDMIVPQDLSRFTFGKLKAEGVKVLLIEDDAAGHGFLTRCQQEKLFKLISGFLKQHHPE